MPIHTKTLTDLAASPRSNSYFILGMIIILSIQLLRIAWIDEDAYITFRAVLNFVAGEGPVWNINDRVQVFTHPLWFLLLSFLNWLGADLITASIATSILLMLGSTLVLFRLNRNFFVILALFALLLNSKAVMEYSTSGLENSLSAFLVSVVCYHTLSQASASRLNLLLLLVTASLTLLNRLDLALLIAPATAYYCFTHYKSKHIALIGAVAVLPLALWHVFSLVYYGFPFPNSYYAKLGTGIEKLDLIKQGVHYYRDSLYADPVTIPTILASIALPFFTKHKQLKYWAIGIILYLIYVLQIGGDYMSGRFFMLPFFVGLFCLAKTIPGRPRIALAVIPLIFLLGLASPAPIILNDTSPKHYQDGAHGIYNERAVWYPANGLLAPGNPTSSTAALMRQWQPAPVINIVRLDAVGGMGLVLGTENHIIDIWAIVDPLLSRLPLAEGQEWHIGHFERKIPVGYIESVSNNENLISDPKISELYQHILEITRGELWSSERWSSIWFMNSGQYKNLTQHYASAENSIAQRRYASIYKNSFVISMLQARNEENWTLLDKLRAQAWQITKIQNNTERFVE